LYWGQDSQQLDPIIVDGGEPEQRRKNGVVGVGVSPVVLDAIPTVIFCSGMTRSASRWSYETCKILERLRTPEDRISVGYLGEHDDYMDACVAAALKAQDGAAIFASHSISQRLVRMVLGGLAKNVYTYRDPRDSIASIMRIDGNGYEPAFDKIYTSLLLFDTFSVDGNSLILAYPEIMDDPIGATTKIAAYLGVDLGRDEIQAVHLATRKSAIERRNIQRRHTAASPPDADRMRRGFESMSGQAASAPNVIYPWRYSVLDGDQYADATTKLRSWLRKMNFSISPIPPWRQDQNS
jgi:hypothetical protein